MAVCCDVCAGSSGREQEPLTAEPSFQHFWAFLFLCLFFESGSRVIKAVLEFKAGLGLLFLPPVPPKC